MGVDGEGFIGNPNKINEFTDDELELDHDDDEFGNFGVLFAEETEDVEEEEDFDYDYDFSLDEVDESDDDEDEDIDDDDDDDELRVVLVNGTHLQVDRRGGVSRENVEAAAAAASGGGPEEVVNDIDNNEIVKSSVPDGTGSANPNGGGNDAQPLPPEGTV